MERAILMDRDGVINIDRLDHVKSWEEFRFIEGVFSALKQIYQANIPVIILTNQSGINRNKITKTILEDIHNKMIKAIEFNGGKITGIYYCPHLPEESCQCRKPEIGLFMKAAEEFSLNLKECIFVGDSFKDIEAGRKAGCQTVLVKTGHGKETYEILKINNLLFPDYICDDLLSSLPFLLNGTNGIL